MDAEGSHRISPEGAIPHRKMRARNGTQLLSRFVLSLVLAQAQIRYVKAFVFSLNLCHPVLGGLGEGECVKQSLEGSLKGCVMGTMCTGKAVSSA